MSEFGHSVSSGGILAVRRVLGRGPRAAVHRVGPFPRVREVSVRELRGDIHRLTALSERIRERFGAIGACG